MLEPTYLCPFCDARWRSCLMWWKHVSGCMRNNSAKSVKRFDKKEAAAGAVVQ